MKCNCPSIKEGNVAQSKFKILPRHKERFRSDYPSVFNCMDLNFIQTQLSTTSVWTNTSLLGVKVPHYITRRTKIWAAWHSPLESSKKIVLDTSLESQCCWWFEVVRLEAKLWLKLSKDCILETALPELADIFLQLGFRSVLVMHLLWIGFFDFSGLSWIK